MVFAICYLATVCAGISASLFSQYLPPIVSAITGAADTGTIGRIGSYGGASFLLGWALGAVVTGTLGDRVGRRMALFLAVLVCSIGIGSTALAQSVPALLIIRFFTGAGAGSIILIAAVYVSEAYARTNRARMVGIVANSFPMGFVVSGVIARNVTDWRAAYVAGSSTIVLAIAVLILLRESDWWKTSEDARVQTHSRRTSLLSPEYRKDLFAGIALFGSMLIALWAVFVWLPTWVGSLAPPHQRNDLRSITNMLLGFGCVVGGFASGPLADGIGRRGAAAFGYVGCLVTTLLIFLPTHDAGFVLYGLVFMLSFFIGSNQGVLVGYVPELFPTLIRGTATGVCFNADRLAGALGVGVLIELFGGYSHAILAFGASYLVGVVALTVARETRGADLPA